MVQQTSVNFAISKTRANIPINSTLWHNTSVILFTIKEVKKFFHDTAERSYGPGQIVIYNGDTPDYVMFVKSGAVKFYDIDGKGNEKILHIAGKGSVFPLFYPFEDKRAVKAFYTTICDTDILLIPLEDFRQKLKTIPQYAFHVLRWYAKEMNHVIDRIGSLEKSKSKPKLLQALFYLYSQHSETIRLKSEWYRVNFPVTQQMLADMTGLTRETVNMWLQEIEKSKIVRNSKYGLDIHKTNITNALSD